MIQKGILPFKFEITEVNITDRSGLVIYAEVLIVFRIRERREGYLPQPYSNRGYNSSKFVEPLLLILYGGGGVEAMAEGNEEVGREILVNDKEERYTLDVDAMVIEADKKDAQWIYKRLKVISQFLDFQFKVLNISIAIGFSYL